MFYSKESLLHIFCYTVFILSCPTIIWTVNTQDRVYGNGWFYFISDNGSNYLMNFSTIPSDTQDMVFGDVHFHLYTRNNTDNPEIITIPRNNNTFESIYFNKSNDIRVVTHGWLSSEKVNWLQNMKFSLLRKFDLNVITVDWSELSHNIVYPYAAFSTRYVGKRIAKLLNAIMETFRISGRDIHLIGHSLGAHIMGYAGMFSVNKIFRITGLDPARPLFEIPEISPDYRLDKNDAEFVDILHTCGGVFGYMKSYGHADFFPNNGRPIQPGCNGVRQIAESPCICGAWPLVWRPLSTITGQEECKAAIVLKFYFILMDKMDRAIVATGYTVFRTHICFTPQRNNNIDSCSHGRSHEYFEESIQYTNKTGFISYPCESWEKFNDGECKENSTSMGYHASAHNIGNFYLHTRNASKYANNTDTESL